MDDVTEIVVVTDRERRTAAQFSKIDGHSPKRFESDAGLWVLEARVDKLPRVGPNFHRVERDGLRVELTEISVPAQIGDE